MKECSPTPPRKTHQFTNVNMSQWRVCEHILFPAFNLGFYVRVLVFIIKEIPPRLWCYFQLERVSSLFAGIEINIFVLRFAQITNIYTGAMDKQLLAKKMKTSKATLMSVMVTAFEWCLEGWKLWNGDFQEPQSKAIIHFPIDTCIMSFPACAVERELNNLSNEFMWLLF